MYSSESIKDWKDLENKVLDIFLSLGYKAEKNACIRGLRAIHEVDVIACIELGSLKYRVVVECKCWRSKIRKAQVATLLTIVSDIGAEKGVIISKSGFQKEAQELANNSNIELYTFRQFVKKTKKDTENWFRDQCFDLINSMVTPFNNFCAQMSEKAEKINEFWYPSKLGLNFKGSIGIFKTNLENLNNKQFPRYFIECPLSEDNISDFEIKRTDVNIKIEDLRLILQHLIEFKKSVELYYDKIYSE